MLLKIGKVESPNELVTDGFSTSMVVTINPPAPYPHVANRDMSGSGPSIRVWNAVLNPGRG